MNTRNVISKEHIIEDIKRNLRISIVNIERDKGTLYEAYCAELAAASSLIESRYEHQVDIKSFENELAFISKYSCELYSGDECI